MSLGEPATPSGVIVGYIPTLGLTAAKLRFFRGVEGLEKFYLVY